MSECRSLVRPGVALAVLVAVAGPEPAAGQDDEFAGPPPTPVKVDAAIAAEVGEKRQVTGNLRATARSEVATLESGRVARIPVREGRAVKAGETIAELDHRRLVLELRRIEAQERSARATLDERTAEIEMRQRDYDALRALEERRASNPKELADALSDLNVALARRDEAQGMVEVDAALADLLRTRIDDAVIRAPFDGVVIRRFTEVGQWVAEGDPIVEIVSVGSCEAWLDVPQRFAGAMIGRPFAVSVDIEAIGARFGPVQPRFIPQVDPTARTFSLVVDLEDGDGRLAPGMSVTAWVPIGAQATHLSISKDGLLSNQTGFYVFVARPGPGPGGGLTATPVTVEPLFDIGDRLAVRSQNLTAGDLVVVEGNERLFPMMPVAVSTAAGGAPAEARE